MKSVQYHKMAAISGATVTLGVCSGSSFEGAPPPIECKPDYLRNNAIVITTNLAAADPTFWACPGYFRVTIERVM